MYPGNDNGNNNTGLANGNMNGNSNTGIANGNNNGNNSGNNTIQSVQRSSVNHRLLGII